MQNPKVVLTGSLVGALLCVVGIVLLAVYLNHPQKPLPVIDYQSEWTNFKLENHCTPETKLVKGVLVQQFTNEGMEVPWDGAVAVFDCDSGKFIY